MNDLHEIARAANVALISEPGFIKCTLDGDPPSMLCYHFDTSQHAEAYKLKREMATIKFPMFIKDNMLIVVRDEKLPTAPPADLIKKWWHILES